MRIVLHTGKGGVGKTTMSAATACAAAAAGYRTLLLSTDSAHSVADVLDVEVGAEPAPVRGVDRLWAAQLDTRAQLESNWSEIRRYLVGALAAHGMARVQAEELTVLPGSDEIVALLAVRRYARSTDPAGDAFDVLVVDCAPSGESLRLLALPETVKFYGERLRSTPARLIRTLAAGLRDSGTGHPAGDGADSGRMADLVGSLLEDLVAARDLLSDGAVTGIRLVVTPERVVIAEARRLLTALALHGFPVEAVVVNRMLPASSTDDNDFVTAWRRQQDANLPLIARSFGHLPLHSVEMTGDEPVGIAALSAIAGQLFDGSDPITRTTSPAGVRTEGENGRYQLLIPLPLADPGSVDLGRTGDELIVTVGPVRRRVTLPSTLRRCRTSGATFAGDTLVVDFEADPRLWPGSLASVLTEADQAAVR